MSTVFECQSELVELAEKQGYLTFDDIIRASERFKLRITEIDELSEMVQLRGIIVYEENPALVRGKQFESEEDDTDYSRTDYESVFRKILKKCPSMFPLINQIRHNPTPQHGEVNLLARQIKEGNAHARERLISLYMRNVLKIALAMSKQYSFELEDAISAGFVGLIYAVDAYSVEEFTTFHSYASMKISRFIQRECAPSWLEYYVPAHAKVKLLKVFQKYHESRWIEDEIGSSQYNQLIQQFALELNMTSIEIDKCLRIINSQLNRIGVGELTHLIETGFYRENQLVNWNETVTAVDQTELEKSMDSLLSDLSEREARVIRLRYGFGNNTPLTLEEVGNIFGVTRERVRQIEGKAMRKLCHPRNRARIESYLYS